MVLKLVAAITAMDPENFDADSDPQSRRDAD